MNAVNEFKGCLHDKNYVYAASASNKMHPDGSQSTYLKVQGGSWSFICTREEFNTLVKECMTNFGSSVTYDEYLKELWANAPDGCVGAVTNRKNTYLYEYGIFVRENKSSTSPYSYCGQTGVSPCMDYFTFTPKPQPKESNMKPVFTQEMSDNGELPQVGMVVMVKNKCDAHPKLKRAAIKYMGDLVVYNYMDCPERCDKNINLVFRPIDTRTDKQKAIDKAKLRWLSETMSIDELL